MFYFYPRPLPYKRPTQKNFDFPKKLEKFKFAKKVSQKMSDFTPAELAAYNADLQALQLRHVLQRANVKLLEKNFETFENF